MSFFMKDMELVGYMVVIIDDNDDIINEVRYDKSMTVGKVMEAIIDTLDNGYDPDEVENYQIKIIPMFEGHCDELGV